MPPTLSSLPAEVLMNILGSLSTEQDLRSATSASPRLRAIFRSSKRSITFGVLQHAVPAEIENDFLLAWRAQSIYKFVPDPNDTVLGYDREMMFKRAIDRVEEETRAIMRLVEVETEKGLYDLIASDSEIFHQLWKFYRRFEHFVLLFAPRALSALQRADLDAQAGSESQSTTTVPLSRSEEVRLKRAFFRFEVFACLSQLTGLSDGGTSYNDRKTLAEPAQTYIKRLSPWEHEEVCCVGQFYVTLMQELCDKIERDFVATVKESEKTYVPTEHDEPAPPPARRCGCPRPTHLHQSTPATLATWLTHHRAKWFDDTYKKQDRDTHIDYIVFRGMLAMWKLTHAPFKVVRKMIVQTHHTSRYKPSIMDQLRHAEVFDAKRIAQLNSSRPGISSGWTWARRPMHYWEANAPCNHFLRDQGYVFWDETRLTKCEIFRLPRSPSKALYVIGDPENAANNGQSLSSAGPLGGLHPGQFSKEYQRYSDIGYIEGEFEGVLVHGDVIGQVINEIYGVFRPGDNPFYSDEEFFTEDDENEKDKDEGKGEEDHRFRRPAKRFRYEIKWRD